LNSICLQDQEYTWTTKLLQEKKNTGISLCIAIETRAENPLHS
jgi:hypothetical protein